MDKELSTPRGGGGRSGGGNSRGGRERMPNRRHRPAPYSKSKAVASSNREDPTQYDGRMVWVNAESTAQSVSHRIVGAALPDAVNGFPVYVFSKYDKNSNTAIKGIVSSQHILQQNYNTTISFKPEFRANRNELTLKVEMVDRIPRHMADPSEVENAQELSVAGGTDPKVLAGAIAQNARNGSTMAIHAIGSKAVFEMLRAVAIAREYLEEDGEGKDLLSFPDFIEVNLPSRNEPTNALRLIAFSPP